jgi:hypothetical protein
MAEGISSYAATAAMNAMGNNTSFAVAQSYIKLHVGAPGAAGTSNPAGNTTRKSISFGTAASNAMSNDTAVAWTSGEVTTSEDYTHFTVWDASTSGNFLFSGTVTANPVTSGDTFTIAIGDLDVAFTIAS